MCVIVDEAYCEFNRSTTPTRRIDLLEHHPNLVLLRTFSKVYGLCGLRVGFALCGSEELPRAVDQVRQPFFCNALAQAAAVEALAHQDAVARARDAGRSPSASRSTSGCARSGSSRPSRRPTSAGSQLGEERDEARIMQRPAGARRARPRPALRSARARRRCASPTALPEENTRFLDALAEVLLAPAR